MGEKWHKDCGGKVKYQKPLQQANFSQAGYCLKCEAFPILEENIIFQLKDGTYERCNAKGWEILRYDELKEVLE